MSEEGSSVGENFFRAARLVTNVSKFANSLLSQSRKSKLMPDINTKMKDEIEKATTRPKQLRPPKPKPKPGKSDKKRPDVDEGGEGEGEFEAGEEQSSSSSSSSSEDLDFYERKRKELERFYERLVYKIEPGVKTRKRTALLAEPNRRRVVGLYDEYKDALEPTGRRQRAKRKFVELTAMTTEELAAQLRKIEKKKKDQEKMRKKRLAIYHKMLNKLEGQCQEKFLQDVFEKFTRYLSSCAVSLEGVTDLTPLNVQRLVQCLEHNIYQTCKVTPEDQKINGSLYKSVASCLTWIIVETLFIAQTVAEKERDKMLDDESKGPTSFVEEEKTRKTTNTQKALEKRAMIAAKKQMRRFKDKDGYCWGPVPTTDELLKLSKLIGCT